MRALVISGGGSKGAFAGGIAEYLIRDCCREYDLYVGCSTGSLLLPHLALGDIEKIKTIYTHVTQKDIFSNCPFRIKKTKTGTETTISHWNTLKSFLKGSASFGDSLHLKKLIQEKITEMEFHALVASDKKIVFTVSNLSLHQMEYINALSCSYEDFCEWAWLSCNYTPFMSLHQKNGHFYADGGFGNFIPIVHALEQGATTLDVIILECETPTPLQNPPRNPFSLLLRTFKFMNYHNYSKDVVIGRLVGLKQEVTLNLYYTPKPLTDNPLHFDPIQMKQWWEEGYRFAQSTAPESYCTPLHLSI